MELDITSFRALFGSSGIQELLILWLLLALLIFVFGIMVAISGGYPTAKWFWKVHLRILGVVFPLSGAGFLLLHLDPLLLLFCLAVPSFVIQGDVAATFQQTLQQDLGGYRPRKRQKAAKQEGEENSLS